MGDPDGKGIDPATDWYLWVRDSTNIQKGLVSGDLPENGINYWNLYKNDHAIAKSLGLNAYRLGIEWSRIFPKDTSAIEVGIERATDGSIAKIEVDDSILEKLERIANKESVDRYRAMIEDLWKRGFKVFVCLNHFTLPLWVHNPVIARDTKLRRGPRGWVDEETIIEFSKYAAYVAWKLGDIVDHWATFNEPMVVARLGYTTPEAGFPPGLQDFRAFRKASIHMVIAHARAYDAIKRWDTVNADRASPSFAEVGIIHNVIPVKPLEPEKELDIKAAEFFNRMQNRFFIQSVVTAWLDKNFDGVKEKGEVKDHLEQRLDWLGVNYYTREVVRGKRALSARPFRGIAAMPETVEGFGFACKPNSTSIDGMPTSDFGWEAYPQGILEALKIMKGYGKPMYITENGIADAEDRLRSRFLVDGLKVLDRGIKEEKIDLRGYFHWALTDNYEWARGFKMKFGLCAVDLRTKERLPRKSATIYKKIVENREVTNKIEKEVKQ